MTTTIAYFAGGCFWCTEAVFQRLHGVLEVTSGYMGGTIKNPAYREICTGRTGHAEGVKIVFDPSVISYTQLLHVFFSTHDPTTLNRQGNDVGTQYRSALFYTDEQQQKEVISVIEDLQESVFDNKIVTEVVPEMTFYTAEVEHQNYYNAHSEQPYCSYVINPKLTKLKASFQQLLKETI